MNATSIWARLGIEPTRDALEIRRAYARALKGTNPEEDPAAFASLRAAYEQALRRARVQELTKAIHSSEPALSAPAQPAPAVAPAAASAVAPAAASAVAPATASVPDSSPTRAEAAAAALTAEMARFEASLAGAIAPDAEALRAQLTACLSSVLLENVATLFAFESWLLGRLWQYRTRAEPVLGLAILRLKWRESRAGSRAAALVAYSDNLQRLRTLGTQHPRALRALTQPPHTARLWSQILLFGVDQQLQSSWEALARAGAMLPETVDRAALAWWCRYFSHPQPSAALVRLAAAALVPLSALLGAWEGSSSDRSVLFATLGAAVGALGSGAIIAEVWAIQRIWHRLKGRSWLLTPWQRLGWLPASLMLCCVAPFVGESVFAAMATAVLAIGLIGWAGWASIAAYRAITPRHVLGVLILNVPVFLWLKTLSLRSTEQLTLALWFSAVGAVAAFTAGSSRLALEFRSSLAPRFQQGARLCLAVISLLGVLLLIRAAIEPPWTRLAAAAIVSLVLLQRTPAGLGLRRAQLKARYWATLVAFLFVLLPLDASGFSPLRVGGVALLLGIVLTMLTCEWNEWAARRQAVRPAEARAGL